VNQNQVINKTMLVVDPIELVQFFSYLIEKPSTQETLYTEAFTFLGERAFTVGVEVDKYGDII